MTGAVLCGVLFLLLGKNLPSDLNITAYGESDIYQPPAGNLATVVRMHVQHLGWNNQASGFLDFTNTFFIFELVSTSIVGQHFFPFCPDNDVRIVVASSYLAIMKIFNYIRTMGSGWLSDRYNNYKILLFITISAASRAYIFPMAISVSIS